MSESANTEGLHKFEYPKGYSPTASEELKKSILEGYAQAEERKRKERFKKIVFIGISLIIAIGITSYLLISK